MNEQWKRILFLEYGEQVEMRAHIFNIILISQAQYILICLSDLRSLNIQ